MRYNQTHAQTQTPAPPMGAGLPGALPGALPGQVDVTQSARIERVNRLDGPRYASLAIVIGGALLAGAVYRLAELTPAALPVLVYVVLTLAALPWVVFGWLAMRETVAQFGLSRSKVGWLEDRLRLDLDGDGLIGAPAAVRPREDDWFTYLVRWWFLGGDTSKRASMEAMKAEYDVELSQGQWQAAREALIEAGLAVTVSKFGRRGFEMKKRSWDQVLAALPPSPQVTPQVMRPAPQVRR